MPRGKVPVLEVDGKFLTESVAICRFVAAKYGLIGKDEWEQAKVDELIHIQLDFYKEMAVSYFSLNIPDFQKCNPTLIVSAFSALLLRSCRLPLPREGRSILRRGCKADSSKVPASLHRIPGQEWIGLLRWSKRDVCRLLGKFKFFQKNNLFQLLDLRLSFLFEWNGSWAVQGLPQVVGIRWTCPELAPVERLHCPTQTVAGLNRFSHRADLNTLIFGSSL